MKLAEQRMNPPELDDASYERNVRNDIRQDIVNAIDTLDDRLSELDRDGFGNTLHKLAQLRDYIVRDWED
jgi:hypothetical protein